MKSLPRSSIYISSSIVLTMSGFGGVNGYMIQYKFFLGLSVSFVGYLVSVPFRSNDNCFLKNIKFIRKI